MVKIAKYTLPDFTASYFVYGDASGLDQEDIDALEQFQADMVKEHGFFHCLGCDNDNEGDFMTHHDLKGYGILACNCIEFSFAVEKNEGDYS